MDRISNQKKGKGESGAKLYNDCQRDVLNQNPIGKGVGCEENQGTLKQGGKKSKFTVRGGPTLEGKMLSRGCW